MCLQGSYNLVIQNAIFSKVSRSMEGDTAQHSCRQPEFSSHEKLDPRLWSRKEIQDEPGWAEFKFIKGRFLA